LRFSFTKIRRRDTVVLIAKVLFAGNMPSSLALLYDDQRDEANNYKND